MSITTALITTTGQSYLAKSTSQIGCVAIDISTASTYTDGGAGSVPRENARKCQAFIDAMTTVGSPKILIVDQELAIADYDSDGIGINIGQFYGGEIHCCSPTISPFLDNGNLNHGPRSQGGFYWAGSDGGTMIQYQGCNLRGSLMLTGAVMTNQSQLQGLIDNGPKAGIGLKVIGVEGLAGSDLDLDMLTCLLMTNGLKFATSFYGDTNRIGRAYFRYINDNFIWIQEQQATGLFIDVLDNDGSPVDCAIYMDGAGDVNVGWAYFPNGTLVKLGSNLGHNVANVDINNGKLDANFGTTNVMLCECYCRDSLARVRIRGSIGTNSPPNKQLVVRHQTATTAQSSQPDIQLDVKNIEPTEAAAYPIRPVKGYGWDSREQFNTSAVASTKLWINPRDLITGTFSEPADGDSLGSGIADYAGVQSTLLAGSTVPTYQKPGINWLPSIYLNNGGYFINSSPSGLSAPSAITIMLVYQEQQASYNNDSLIFAISNTDGTNPIHLVRNATTGKLRLSIGSTTTLTSDNAVPYYKPVLLIAQWIGATQTITYWVDGVRTVKSGAPSSVGSQNGSLLIGRRQTGVSTFLATCRGYIGDMFVDTAAWDIASVDTSGGSSGTAADSNDPPNLASWNSTAAQRVKYLRAAYGVF